MSSFLKLNSFKTWLSFAGIYYKPNEAEDFKIFSVTSTDSRWGKTSTLSKNLAAASKPQSI